ncbi:MAG: hypothetical protein E7Z75_09960 [Methanobrevibacter olleyae]|uniref:Uncharacterized protein n=1 Tax=Methanobrevibacter olleyae TaxID=294671 RepID=A0A8T3VPN3_METOL|nr:hypothetical protein [Methanobrevibacter olleyae]
MHKGEMTMKPEEVKRMEEEEDEEFVGLNVDTNLLEVVQILFKTEPEVEVFYDGFLERIQSDKKLRKTPDDRKRMNSAFLDELLKYHDLDTINDAINGVSRDDELVSGQDEKDVDRILRKTFKNKVEFRMFMTYISQFMMENKDTPVEAAAKSMKLLGKSDHETLQITNVIDKIF